MAMEVVFLPLVGLHVLIRIVEICAAKRFWFLETVSGNGEVDVQYQQEHGDAKACHHPAEIKPKTFLFTHTACKTNGKNWKAQNMVVFL